MVLTQPIYDPASRRFAEPAALEAASAARATAGRVRQGLVVEVVDAWIRVRSIDAALDATNAFVDSLRARLDEMEAQ